MADAEDSKSFARKGVRVQIPLRARTLTNTENTGNKTQQTQTHAVEPKQPNPSELTVSGRTHAAENNGLNTEPVRRTRSTSATGRCEEHRYHRDVRAGTARKES
jgi:Fe-S cluster assembly scaffold protein SufB